MTKLEFIKELGGLLLDIPIEEREEALQYYENYFDDAGPEREESIINELGSPAKVAKIIKADLYSSDQTSKSRGYFTEKGYEDELLQEPKYEIMNGTAIDKEADNTGNTASNGYAETKSNTGNYSNTGNKNNTGSNSNAGNYGNAGTYGNTGNNYSNNSYRSTDRGEKKNNNSNLAWIILICVLAIPVGIPLISVAFGLFLAIFFTVVGISIAFICVSIALTFAGIVLAIFGLIKLVAIPVLGICLAGAGLILFGIGLLFTIATIGLCTKVVPSLIRGFVNLCRKPFRNRRVMA